MSNFIYYYAIGFAIAYAICFIIRQFAKANEDNDRDATLRIALASWLGILFIVFFTIDFFLTEPNNKKNKENE